MRRSQRSARARRDAAALAARSAALEASERSLAARAEIVDRSLKASQERVATLLRALYIQGEPDPISVILGATSLDEAVAGIEGLSRATAQNRRLSGEATAHARKLVALRAQLVEERARLDPRRERRARERFAPRVSRRGTERHRRGRTARSIVDDRATGCTRGTGAGSRTQVGRDHVELGSSPRALNVSPIGRDDRDFPGAGRVGTPRHRRRRGRGSSLPTRSPTTFPARRRAASRSASA